MKQKEQEELAKRLFEIGAIQFGEFQLNSEQASPIYIDLRLLASFPGTMKEVAKAYAGILSGLQFDLLAAVPYSALPIGTAISLELDIPLIYPRKELKSYGTGKGIEGVWQAGQRVALVEDLITSGKSVLSAMTRLEEAGLRVVDTVVLIDRQQPRVATLAQEGRPVHAALTLTALLTSLTDNGLIADSQKDNTLKALGIIGNPRLQV